MGMIGLPDITTVTVPLPVLAQFGFYIVTGLYAVFTMILYYHWNQYSTNAAMSRLTTVMYLIITLPLIIMIGILTFFIH
jgi:hypothetical protein